MHNFKYDLCFETPMCICLKSYPHNSEGLEEAFKQLEHLGDEVKKATIVSTRDYAVVYEYPTTDNRYSIERMVS